MTLFAEGFDHYDGNELDTVIKYLQAGFSLEEAIVKIAADKMAASIVDQMLQGESSGEIAGLIQVAKECEMALKDKTDKPLGTDYSEHLESKPIVSMTSVEKKGAGQSWSNPQAETVTEHPGVFVKKFTGMSITVEGGRTLNLGDYNSARIGVTITVPCEPSTLKDAYDWATNWVSDRIEEEISQAKGHD